jgi:hypothetical protein
MQLQIHLFASARDLQPLVPTNIFIHYKDKIILILSTSTERLTNSIKYWMLQITNCHTNTPERHVTLQQLYRKRYIKLHPAYAGYPSQVVSGQRVYIHTHLCIAVGTHDTCTIPVQYLCISGKVHTNLNTLKPHF